MKSDPVLLPRLLDTDAAAQWLGISASFLEKARFNRDPDGPPFVRIGSRSIRYDVRALETWLAARAEGVR